MIGYSYRQNFWLETASVTFVTRLFPHIALYISAHKITVCFFVPALQVRNYPLIGCVKAPSATQRNIICIGSSAVQNPLQILKLKLASRYMKRKSELVCHSLEFFHIPCICGHSIKGAN